MVRFGGQVRLLRRLYGTEIKTEWRHHGENDVFYASAGEVGKLAAQGLDIDRGGLLHLTRESRGAYLRCGYLLLINRFTPPDVRWATLRRGTAGVRAAGWRGARRVRLSVCGLVTWLGRP